MFTIPTKETFPSRISRKAGKAKKAEAVLVEDWQYFVDHTNDYYTNCEEYGCDDYCRCGVIENVEVNNSISGVETFFNGAYTNYGTDLDKVLDFWFTKINFSNITWDFEASGGYYGEELERIFIESDNNFFKKAETFSKLSAKSKIEYLLKEEYGNVLPEIALVEEWQLKKVKAANISIPINTKLNSKVLEGYKTFCEHKKSARMQGNRSNGKIRTEKAFLNDLQILAPLCLSIDDIHYRLIDGRHRFNTIVGKSFELISWDKTGNVVRNKISPNEIWIICPKD